MQTPMYEDVGEIKVDAAGRFVYVSNHGHNSIAIFAIDPATGLLSLAGIDSTQGRCPRLFGLAPCGQFAVVGAQDDDKVVWLFRLCPDTGRLAARSQQLDAPTPNFVLFAPPHALAGTGADGGGFSSGALEGRARRGTGVGMAPMAVCAS